MASNISLPLLKSNFLGRNDLSNFSSKPCFTFQRRSSPCHLKTYAKFNLFEILGGRGLLNGERGVEKELTKNVEEQAPAAAGEEKEKAEGEEGSAISAIDSAEEGAFDKELMGLTGGFPGGETGLRKFIEKNPPPKKPPAAAATVLVSSKKPKAPELPLLLPGMIAIVSNQNSPYHMYCGIVQRITDGKSGVLFEGGNWDRLITFRLEELTRREKGPPGKNPRSAILEPLLLKDSE